MVQSPFQTICCVQPSNGQQPFLVSASGPVICSLDLKTGSLLSQWPRHTEEAVEDGASTNPTEDDQGRPMKRRRLDEEEPVNVARKDSENPAETISEPKKGEQQKPNVTHIITTSDGATVVTITAEDKSINAFNVEPEGVLSLQSQRSMPKRVCAIVLTPDEKNILVGDKFGDVYLLPLHPRDDWTPPKVDQDEQERPFTPSASELTVHSKRNREALRNQRDLKIIRPKKEGPNFERKLILGHVSLLTDVAITEVLDGLKRKQYILTADRDEHIRVSRGITQAHIIEGYCLGHRDFVSKLCIPPWEPEYLIAGSGEPSLKVHHWRTSRLIDEELFQGAIRQDLERHLDVTSGERSMEHLAVSNIWPVHYSVGGNSPYSHQPPHCLLVALEGYNLTKEGKLQHHQTVELGGNALDVAVGPALWDIVVSIDTVHKPGSVKEIKREAVPKSNFFETFSLFSNLSQNANGTAPAAEQPGPELRWERSSLAVLLNDAVPMSETSDLSQDSKSKGKGTYSALGEQLYGLENLRKRRGDQDQPMDADEEEAGESPAIAV
ncbi:tRNA (guanine-N(7)-)-methyltransferase non-catalytic subunit trm82 [Exophiala oligosperma]